VIPRRDIEVRQEVDLDALIAPGREAVDTPLGSERNASMTPSYTTPQLGNLLRRPFAMSGARFRKSD
jgi:hypothetical protein